MFKFGEIAGVKSQDSLQVTILSSPLDKVASHHKWPVNTSAGVFDETELFVAHPSVLATANGRNKSSEDVSKQLALLDAAEVCLPYELRKLVEESLKKSAFDWNGHWKSGKAIYEGAEILDELFLGRDAMSERDAGDLIQAINTGIAMDRWAPVNAGGIRMTLRTCPFCGEEDFTLETNGPVLRLAGDPCKFADGLPPTEWELNVPSGKLVIANDLRELFPLPEDEDFDINTPLGCRQTALAYAANGLSHAYVGNTCPGVYSCGKNTFKIVNPPSNEKWNGEEYVKVTPKPKFKGKRIAGICTDLWWYSICDYEEFRRRCRRFKHKVGDFNTDVVNVKPGVYRFRHNEDAREHKEDEERVYTQLEWVRKPDPVQDFLAAYETAEVTPHAYVQAQVARWPTLFGKTNRVFGREEVTLWEDMSEEDRHHSWQRIADQVFCTIGGGVEWHEKGFPRAKVDLSVPDVEPPSFREQHHWYPFSKPYGGLFREELAPSFAKMAFRVLESVISFGTGVHDSSRSRDVRHVRERMLVAVKRYRQLAKKYPDQADPEYVAWLKQKGRAEAWVENFDLGPEFTEHHREYAARQRWVPEDAFAVEFDARKLSSGHFAWHPKEPSVGGCWASKANAQRYAIVEWSDNGQPPEHNCFWSSHARNTSVPLYFVARVKKVGEVSHMGSTLIEVTFDYGTPWMTDAEKRKALVEEAEKDGMRVLSEEEYENLLPEAKRFFEEAEAQIRKG